MRARHLHASLGVHLGMDRDRAVRAATIGPLQGPKRDKGGDDDV